MLFVDEGVHDAWGEDWIDETGGIVRRPLIDGSVHRAVKVIWRPDELARRLQELGWDASVTAEGPFYWGVAQRTIVALATIWCIITPCLRSPSTTSPRFRGSLRRIRRSLESGRS